MALRKQMKRCWLVQLAVQAAGLLVASSFSLAQTPLPSARVSGLEPLDADQAAPVVTAMTIDPSTKWLAVAGDDKSIRILEADNFKEVARLRGHRDLIRTLSFRADGKILVSAGNDGSLILWDRTNDYREIRRVDDLPAVSCASFSPDGKQIAAVGFGTKVMMFGATADRLPMRCQCSDLRACVYDSSGDRLAVVDRSGFLHLFDPRTGAELNHYELHNGRIRDCQFTSDGKRTITVGEDGAAVLFDLERGEVVKRIDLLPCKLFTLAQIDDRHVAVAGSDNRIRVVNFDTGLVATHLDGHRGSISNLAYARGALFSGGFDATLRRWPLDADEGERIADKKLDDSSTKTDSSSVK